MKASIYGLIALLVVGLGFVGAMSLRGYVDPKIGNNGIPVKTVAPPMKNNIFTAVSPTDTTQIDPTATTANVVDENTWITGLYNMRNETYFGTPDNPYKSDISRGDGDVRLGNVFGDLNNEHVYFTNKVAFKDTTGKEFVKAVRAQAGTSLDKIVAISDNPNSQDVVYIERDLVRPALPATADPVSQILLSRFTDGSRSSFQFGAKEANNTYNVAIYGLMRGLTSSEKTIQLGGHTVSYVDFYVYIPGKGIKKDGLATYIDGGMNGDGILYSVLQNYAEGNQMDMFSIITKFMFEDANSENYNTVFTNDKWTQSMGLGSGNLHPMPLDIMKFLPKNYYEDFLRTGGDTFVIFFSGDHTDAGISNFKRTRNSSTPWTQAEIDTINQNIPLP